MGTLRRDLRFLSTAANNTSCVQHTMLRIHSTSKTIVLPSCLKTRQTELVNTGLCHPSPASNTASTPVAARHFPRKTGLTLVPSPQESSSLQTPQLVVAGLHLVQQGEQHTPITSFLLHSGSLPLPYFCIVTHHYYLYFNHHILSLTCIGICFNYLFTVFRFYFWPTYYLCNYFYST